MTHNNSFFKSLFFFFLLFSFLSLQSCQTKRISELPQEAGIERIKSFYEKKDWDQVIDLTSEYKIRYPYSKYSTEADLMQADAYYQSNKLTEAIFAYEDFAKKYPSHANVPLAHYRIAKSYDLQAPDVESRDQSNTKKAIEKYTFFVQTDPESQWTQEAKERITLLSRRLADSTAFVAEFYWHTDHCAAALSRYLDLLENQNKYTDLESLAKQRAAFCYDVLAKQLEKDPTSKENVYFQSETPDSLQQKAASLRL